jgi:hypothetical protein
MLMAREQESNSAAIADANRVIADLKAELDHTHAQHRLEAMNKDFQWGQCELELRQTIANLKADAAKVLQIAAKIGR